jgi:hypothetical protein
MTGEIVPHGKKELTVDGIKVEEHQSGIPLIGWDSVRNALYAFAEGKSRASRATERHNINAYSQMDPLAGFGFALRNNQVRGDQFIDGMLEEAQPQIESRGQWSRSYDYDGQGRFHKTTVEITTLPEQDDTYLLELNAAYVGKEVEEGLAEYLDVRRGLQWKNAEVEVNSRNNTARIDFDNILGRLKGVRDKLTKPPTRSLFRRDPQPSNGKEIVDAIMKTDEYSSPKPVVLGTDGQLEVTLGLGRVGRRYEWQSGNPGENRYQAEGGVLTVPLDTDYRDESKTVPATVKISIRRQSESEYNRLPIVDEREKAKADRIMSEIRASLT